MSQVTPVQFRDNLFAALDAFWNDRTPIAWPNLEFDPDRAFPTEADDDAWLEVQVLGDSAGQVPIGSSVGVAGAFRRSGSVTLSVYVRGNTATDLLYQLADAASQFLEARESRAVANTVFSGIGHQEIGFDGTWYQLNVTAAFTYFTDRG